MATPTPVLHALDPAELPPGRLAFSPTELADALGVTRVHVQNMIARGELRSVKLGRRRLIPVAVVAELLDGTKTS